MSARDDVEGRLLGRSIEIGRVIAKYAVKDRADHSIGTRARNLKLALQELGPTFAKLGQILSTRPDLLPPEFIEELSELQDRVQPLTEAEVVLVMEEELGVPWEDVFESIDPEPLAAGTLGQVHRATLGGGERVVVKVQRPGARDEIMRDLGLLELFAGKAEGRDALLRLIDLPSVIEHLSDSLRRELDFSLELANTKRFKTVLAPYDRLGVPEVYEQLSTSRFLVLEEIQGVRLREAPNVPEKQEAARQFVESFYRQILTDGFFHADPHPGNLMWWNGIVYFLDAGMVGELDPRLRELMLLLMMAFWRQDDSFLSEVVLQLGDEQMPPDLDLEAFERDVVFLFEGIRGRSIQDIQLGPVMEGLTQIAAQHGVRLPASLALTGKALAQMQLAAAELDPELDPFSVIGRFLLRGLFGRVRESIDPKRAFYGAQKAKVRVTRLLEAIERVTGARPGRPFQLEVRGIASLEQTIRRSSRLLALAFMAASSLIGAAITGATQVIAGWVPATLGGFAAFLTVLLLAELFRR